MNFSEILYVLVMYLTCVFEIFLIYDFLEETFPIYEDRKGVSLLEAAGCVTLVFLIKSFKIPMVNLYGEPLIFIFFVWLMFRIEFKYNLLYVICFCGIVAVSEFVFQYIYTLFGIDVTTAQFDRVLLLISEKVFEFLVIQVIKKWQRNLHQNDSYKYQKSLFVLPVASLILLNGFLSSGKSMVSYFLICLGGVLLIVANVVDFRIVEKMVEAQTAVRDAELLLLKTKLEQNHYQRLEEVNRDYANYMHEMRHMIRTIEQLVSTENNDSIKELAAEISLRGKPPARKYYIGDRITEAIIMECEKKAKDLRVEYHVEVQPGLDLDFLDDMDKIIMFGNLLDNALEAAAVSDALYMSVSLYWGNKSFLIFKVENSFKIKAFKSGRRYLTIKGEKRNHGFGIKNVEELSKKYGGMLNINESKNVFTATLLLSNSNKM